MEPGPVTEEVGVFLKRFVPNNEKVDVSFSGVFKGLGVVKSSINISNEVDVEWLLMQYDMHQEMKSIQITILYSNQDPKFQEALDRYLVLPNVNVKHFEQSLFSSQLTKMILLYEDGSMRYVVATGNLTERDWDKNSRRQGLWMSNPLTPIKSGPTGAGVGDSEKHFKRDLLNYLEAYRLPEVVPWIKRVRNADCKDVNSPFIIRLPGINSGELVEIVTDIFLQALQFSQEI